MGRRDGGHKWKVKQTEWQDLQAGSVMVLWSNVKAWAGPGEFSP